MLNPPEESNYLPTNCGCAAWVDGVPVCQYSTIPCTVYYGQSVECELARVRDSLDRLAESFKKARGENND